MKSLAKLISLLFLLHFLTGCIGKVVKDVEKDIQDVRNGPREIPMKNITDFSEGLRCMDSMFEVFNYSPNELVILLEDIKDKTKKVDAGAREMLISALSNMARRSQVIQVIAYGTEASNLVSFLEQAGQKGVYSKIPQYDIIGSVTQLDKDIVRKQADLATQVDGTINKTSVGGGVGVSASNSASLLGVDLSVITTNNIAVLPGVTTRNTAVIYRTGSARDFDAGISKTGITYSVSSNKADGAAIALRALIELSAIELIGKLTKIPYWICLGLDPQHHAIRNEISDWYYQLSRSNLIHRVTQVQLFLRGYYDGPIDGYISAEYEQAIVNYKGRLGLEDSPGVDLEFYQAFLNDTPNSVKQSSLAYLKGKNPDKVSNEPIREKNQTHQKSAPARNADVTQRQERTISDVKDEVLTLLIKSKKQIHELGAEVQIIIKSSVSGFVNCYFISKNKILKIFPNRFSTNGFISSTGSIVLPDSDSYSIVADKKNESIQCFLVTRKVYTDLPNTLKQQDFQPLPILDIEHLKSAYKKATLGRYAYAMLTIETN